MYTKKCREHQASSFKHRDDGDTLQVVGGVPSNSYCKKWVLYVSCDSEHPMGQRLTPGSRLTVYTVLCICIHIYIYRYRYIFYMYVYAYTYTYYSSSFVLVFSESSPEIQPQNWIQKSCSDITATTYWELVGGLEHIVFFHILGMSSSQLTNSYFSEG